MPIYKSGTLRADKIEYPDGVGYSVWRPFPEGDEGSGIAFDFTEEEMPYLIILLGKLIKAKAELYEEDKISKLIRSLGEDKTIYKEEE